MTWLLVILALIGGAILVVSNFGSKYSNSTSYASQAGFTSFDKATATAQTIQNIIAPLDKRAVKIYGPANGNIEHPNGNYVGIKCANVTLRNSLIDAWFFNPYGANEGTWDYGFFIRNSPQGQYRLIISSGRRWNLYNGNNNWVAGNALSDLNIAQGGSNHLVLYVSGSAAYFYLNEKYISTLEVGDILGNGDICVGTGFLSGNVIAGRITRYDNFTVYSLD
ncbi:MAG: hypothetical protein HXX08_14945 [Chloroflexi bacterium]|uniref:Uncharacterized protein n=1 Tax=Candidatus Chlorohelix allophototropha TaxID=3003348 RepID=A0A8T7M538_9CHLR|nr:hypothetical protein [Chloroflexota bacterium]WJW69068.1 hypothetical protein OZ401_002661 [Chloroflexota bacterium L227-S17]